MISTWCIDSNLASVLALRSLNKSFRVCPGQLLHAWGFWDVCGGASASFQADVLRSWGGCNTGTVVPFRQTGKKHLSSESHTTQPVSLALQNLPKFESFSVEAAL